MEEVDLETALVLAEIHCGIDAIQLARMPRVVSGLDSALNAPFAGYADAAFYPEFEDKAAILCSRIVRNHPLPDGNKRTAYDVLRVFIDFNGRTFTHGPGGLDETADMIERLAADTVSEPDFAAWLRDRIT